MIQAWADYLFQLKDGYAEVDEKASIFRKKGWAKDSQSLSSRLGRKQKEV